MQAVDLFGPLDRVVSKYRSDVHRLPAQAPGDAITALEGHLGRALPHGLRRFLTRHNGAQLFRGALHVRSASEMAIASEDAPEVILFADESDVVRWAWSSDAEGRTVFGVWDGERLEPFHTSFAGWLRAAIAVLDARVKRREDREDLRFEADPEDLCQLLRAGERALLRGDPELAEVMFRSATAKDTQHVLAWQRLGEALAVSDRVAARRAWLQAFRLSRFPLPWPGAPCIEPDLVRQLAAAFTNVEEVEQEFQRFLDDRVMDVRTPQAAEVTIAAARQLARTLVGRGRRRAARQVLADLVQRCTVFTLPIVPWDGLLELANLEVDLGLHDDAENRVRRIRREGPKDLRGAGQLLLARIAVSRQEPWAEEILDEASDSLLSEHEQVQAAALRIERALRQERGDVAAHWLVELQRVAPQVPGRKAAALAALAEGDALKAQEQVGMARKVWQRAIATVSPTDDPETLLRIHVRLGDLELSARHLEEASQHYLTAARGFASHELPVREAWTLLRLARLSDSPERVLKSAHERFAEAQLSAGIAAVDAMRGDPGLSLLWHLNLATAHARARHHAQRARPPWDRADADRPERRLGAHRLAIAGCEKSVVTSIEAELDQSARAMVSGRARPTDPPVLRYVAAVDLLAGHPSFEAAQVLLRHLLSRAVDGPARKALQGAIARSPNAALVDGLLTCIEQPQNHPAHSVAEAAELLGLRRETAAVPALVRLAAPKANPISRKAAVLSLGRIGDRSAVPHLLPTLEETPLAEATALALLLLGDRRGVDFHGRALDEGRRDLSGSPGEIVGRFGGPQYLLLLRNVAAGDDERAMGALQGLGLLGDPRGVSTLLEKLDSRNRKVAAVAAGALSILTGHSEDIEDPGGKTRWNLWWEQKSGGFKEGLRHRDGAVFDAGVLIRRMSNLDPWTRRTAYDELVILSGERLPFDAEGPWRVQRSHLRAWQRWWVKNAESYIPGAWYLDGDRVG